MEKIWCIIDMDGFRVNNSFQCRELAVYYTATGTYENWFFDNGPWSKLSESDKKTNNFCFKYVHGLKFGDHLSHHPVYPISYLNKILIDLSKNLPKNCTIAYKGGHIEKDALNAIGEHNHVNLENFGCPKLSELTDTHWQCGEHYPVGKGMIHCPVWEVVQFGRWLNKRLQSKE